jgi:glycosyltransferase involved in cell wall biosynthesis
VDAPSWCPRPLIVTVLDLIPLVLADLYSLDKPSWRFKFARSLELRAIRNARLVIAISDHTAADVIKYVGVREERIAVTPLGVDQSFARVIDEQERKDFQCRYDLPPNREIVLYIGGIDPRKNWPVLLAAFNRVLMARRERGQSAPLLVMAGRLSADEQYPLLMERLQQLQMKDDVILLDTLEDNELQVLLSLAAVFFFPSLYEGFGLTPLEAMAAGVPVVSSNASCLPEILGGAALYVRPDDADGACRSLLSVLNHKELALDLSERGRLRAGQFTWSQTAASTVAAYEMLLRGR